MILEFLKVIFAMTANQQGQTHWFRIAGRRCVYSASHQYRA